MTLYYIVFLTFFSSIPYSLLSYTLQNWQLDAHISIGIVSAFSYMQMPYLLNPIWGFVMDRYHYLANERMHLLAGMASVLIACIGFSQLSSPTSVHFWGLGLLMCFGGAWFDAALGAYRSYFAKDFLAQMSAAINLSYRAGMIIFQAGLIFLAKWTSWQHVYFILSILAGLFFITVLFFHLEPPQLKAQQRSALRFKIHDVWQWVWQVLSWPVVLFLFLFNASHFWVTTMMVSYFREVLGISSAQVATAQKGAGLICLMAFTVMGLLWLKRLRLSRISWLMTLQLLVCVAMFLICKMVQDPVTKMYDLVILESAVHGVMSTYIVAFVLEMAPSAFPAMGVALMTSIAMSSRSLISPLGGWVYEMGEGVFWAVAIALACLGIWVSNTPQMQKICSRKTQEQGV